MAKYKDIYGNITEVGNPEWNPELIAGKTLVSENTPLTSSDKINSTILQPTTAYTPPPKPEDKTNPPGLMANGQAMIDYLNKQMTSTPSPEPTDWFTKFNPETMYKNLYEQGGLEAKSQDVITKQTAVKQAQNELNLLNAQMAGLTAESQAVPIRLQQEATGRGITTGGLAPIQAGQLREIALRSLPLQAQILGAQAKVQSAQGDVDTANQTLALAQDKINTLFRLQSTAAEQQYNYQKELRDRYYQQASDKQKLVLEKLQKEDDRNFQIEQDNRNNAQALSLKAMENGQGALAGQITALDPKSPTFITDLQKLQGQIVAKPQTTSDITEYNLAKTQGYIGTFMDWQKQAANLKATASTPITTPEINKILTGEFGDVISSASNLVTTVSGKAMSKQAISESIANGDYTSAYAQIANNIENSLQGTSKSKFADARTDYGIMLGLKTAIQNYADNGGNMDLLTGKEEDIKRKLGIDSGKASTLAVQLWREFQTYRSNMTGAAFTEKESRDYASVNPTLGKSLNLNLSVIDGALNQLENRITATVNSRIPNADKIYKRISGNQDGLSDDDAYKAYLEQVNKGGLIFSPTGK